MLGVVVLWSNAFSNACVFVLKKGIHLCAFTKTVFVTEIILRTRNYGICFRQILFQYTYVTFTSKKGQGILTDLLNLTTIFESKFAYPSQIPSLMPQQTPRYSWSWRNKSSESIGVNTGLFFPKIRWGERKENRKWCQWKWPPGSICPIWG